MSMNEESVYPSVRLEKQNIQKEKILKILSSSLRIVFLVVSMLPAFAIAGVEVYFLRHSEADNSNPDKPLVAAGQARAEALAEHLAPVQVTHIFVTNYYRNVDTAKPLASSKKLEVVQVPKIGSTIDGKEVTNRSRGVATQPMLRALNDLSDGSVAVVVANSGNLFPIMSKFGVSQLPCNSKKCFPKKEFNNIWIVTKSADGTNLRTEKYGR